MELEEDATGRDRLARMLAAAGLTVAAAAALFRRGKRITGALGGYRRARAGLSGDVRGFGDGADGESGGERHEQCAGVCDLRRTHRPRPARPPAPTRNDDIVHVDCREATAETAD